MLDETVTLSFDLALHAPISVQQAVYRFSDKFAALVRVDEQRSAIICELSFVASFKGSRPEILRQFQIEVLDQELRRKIRDETENERNLILAHAFSKTPLIDE